MAQAATRMAQAAIRYHAAREQFSAAELSDLTLLVVAINGWNRLNVAFRTVPGSADAAYGLDKAGLR